MNKTKSFPKGVRSIEKLAYTQKGNIDYTKRRHQDQKFTFSFGKGTNACTSLSYSHVTNYVGWFFCFVFKNETSLKWYFSTCEHCK